MAFTAADLAALDQALLKGEVQVRFADREVTYRSIDELLKVRDLVAADLAVTAPPATPVPKQHLGSAGKGF